MTNQAHEISNRIAWRGKKSLRSQRWPSRAHLGVLIAVCLAMWVACAFAIGVVLGMVER